MTRQPLLPRGEMIFDALPGRSIVAEAMVPAVGTGVIVASTEAQWAVIVCREGRPAGTYAHAADATFASVQAARDATVSAWRLSAATLDSLPMLLGGEPVYADLRAAWVGWEALVEDLRGRGGDFLVSLQTPSVAGVVHISEGGEIVAFTDRVPVPGDASRVRELLETPECSISVLRPAVAATPELLHEPARDPLRDSHARRDDEPDAAGDATFLALFGRRDDALEAGAPRLVHDQDVRSLVQRLKLIVRSRLELSSPRLEEVIDRAAARRESLASLAADVRATPLRGVTQATLDDIAEAMLAAGQG